MGGSQSVWAIHCIYKHCAYMTIYCSTVMNDAWGIFCSLCNKYRIDSLQSQLDKYWSPTTSPELVFSRSVKCIIEYAKLSTWRDNELTVIVDIFNEKMQQAHMYRPSLYAMKDDLLSFRRYVEFDSRSERRMVQWGQLRSVMASIDQALMVCTPPLAFLIDQLQGCVDNPYITSTDITKRTQKYIIRTLDNCMLDGTIHDIKPFGLIDKFMKTLNSLVILCQHSKKIKDCVKLTKERLAQYI